MKLLTSITNVARAGIAVCLSPAAVVADICTLPASAYNEQHPFGRTARLLGTAGECVKEAVRPVK